MAGTKEGGRRCAETNKQKYGPDFYKRIGAMGGKNGHTGGWAVDIPCTCTDIEGNHVLRQCAGARGGRISRRPKMGV